MATSSLIRLLTALLMLTGLALSSSLAWAHDALADSGTSTIYKENKQPDSQPPSDDTKKQADEQPTSSTFPPAEADMPYSSYNQERGGFSSAWIVTRDALIGGVFGALLGTAGYFISGRDWSPLVIVYSAAGGVVLGTAVGLVSVLTGGKDRNLSASIQYLERALPRTAQLQFLNFRF